MKIEECKVGMRVKVTKLGGRVPPGSLNKIMTVLNASLYGLPMFQLENRYWYMQDQLSPAPDEQEEIAESLKDAAQAGLPAFPNRITDADKPMLSRDEVPEETKQVLTREPKENPWYSRITPMSERVKQV